MTRMKVTVLAGAVALALAVPSAALAQSNGTSGYKQTPKPPTTTPTTTTKPSTGTGPSKPGAPVSSTAPSTSSTSPSSATAAESAKSSTLPFTGLDLRWIVLGGVLLMAAGMSIRVVQRRHG